MLEWKFRLVILLGVASSCAVMLGNYGWLLNHGW
jgi:hypothetical protein